MDNTIPGDALPLTEADLYQTVGRLTSLLELEQKKRVALAQAYMELKAERDRLQDALNTVSEQK